MVTSSDEGRPLISCVLPTYNRRGFLPHAIHYFLRQDYPHKELVVVDDGPDAVGDLIPADPRIRYIRLPHKVTLGAKLNLCCAEARGPIIAQWDDDDWYGRDRLTRQMLALQRTNTDVCGISDLLYYDVRRGSGHRYIYPPHERPWLLGASLFFRRELWERNRFAEVDVGMDGLFVWATPPEKVCSLPEPRFAVHLIHSDNISPKSPQGAWWSDHPVGDIADVIGEDWQYYAPGDQVLSCPRPRTTVATAPRVEPASVDVVVRPPPPPASGTRNVYACLVHESRESVIDLCRNLRNVDQDSKILLYNGGDDSALLAPDPIFDQLGVVVHPGPRPMRWGALHHFALDCMRFAQADEPFGSLTIVDSDQLALRPGWPARIQDCLTRDRGIGLFGNQPERLSPPTDNAAALTAWREIELWRPFLRRFPDGEDKFVHWSFWPGTVFSADAAAALVDRFDHDDELREILRQSHLWVTEEIVFPTLTALLGFGVARSPDSYNYLRYRYSYSWTELEGAFADPNAYWIHPIPRRLDDPLRVAVRQRVGHTEAPSAPEPAVTAPGPTPLAELRSPSLSEIRPPILDTMRQVSGWLADDEADLLITTTDRALAACPDARALVEVGSFRGKGTTVLAGVVRAMRPTARVWAMDPHDGVVGDPDRGVSHESPTLEAFRHNIQSAGLEPFVETVQAKAPDVAWSEPICLLLVDGLHDYASVARDFRHFEPFLADSALVAFHDYADYFPGVKTFVDELLRGDRYVLADRASSMIVLRKQVATIATPVEAAAPEPLAAAS